MFIKISSFPPLFQFSHHYPPIFFIVNFMYAFLWRRKWTLIFTCCALVQFTSLTMTMIDSCNKSHSPLKVTDNSCSVEKTCTTNACNKSLSPQKATDNSCNIEKPSTTDAACNKSHSLQKQTDNSCNVQKPTTTNAEDLQNLLSELEKLNDKRIGIMKGFDVYVCHSTDPPSSWKGCWFMCSDWRG